MAKKIVKAREIVIPHDLPELLDKKAGRPKGELRNLCADDGNLREIDKWAMKVAMGFTIKNLMETPALPAKPMSLERFSHMMWVVTLAYTLGTLKVDDTGEVQIGRVTDIGFVAKVMEADEFQFRNGRKVPAEALMPVLQHLTSEDAIKQIYADIAGKGIFKRTELQADHAMNLAELVMTTTDNIADAKFWD